MWQDFANSLLTGRKGKFQHCGTSKAAIAYKNLTGIGFKCYRCADEEFEAFGARSVAEVLAARAELARIDERSTSIPDGSITLDHVDVPPEARLWVLKAGLTPETASQTYGFKWHEKTRRVFIPVGNAAILARAVYKGDAPKYRLFGPAGSVLFRLPGSGPLVVVEDVLSAIKVNRAGYSSCAVLGTSLSATDAAKLSCHKTIVVWTDPDKGGALGRQAIKKALGLYPVTVVYARTTSDLDPKLLSTETIRATIEATMKNVS